MPPLQTANQRKELQELREMKEDVERREKAQAEVISQQVRRGRARGWWAAMLPLHATGMPLALRPACLPA